MLNQALKILLPALVLASIPLNVRGETWRKERRGPSPVGWAVISVGLIVALVSGWTSWNDQKIKEDEKHAAEQSQKKALDDQIARFAKVLDNQKIAKTTLDQASMNLGFAFQIALTQLPVDLLEVWIRRKEIASILPQGVSAKDQFAFTKRLGPFQLGKSERDLFETVMFSRLEDPV